MAKRSNRRASRNEKDQLGCMWGLISMFDFRLGRSAQGLLSDKMLGNKNAAGVGNSGNKLDMSTSSDEEKTKASDACKPSVKKLLEEEMFRKQAAKKELNDTEVEAKQFDSMQGNDGRTKRKRKNKARKKSSGTSLDTDAAENLLSEVSCRDNSEEQQTTSSLDMDNLMKEFCCQIHRKRVNCLNHGQPAEGHMQLNPKSSDFEERLSEAIEFLVSRKLINRNQLTEEDGELQVSNEVMDALRILSLDEELLVKYVQNMSDSRLKDEECKSLAASNLSENKPVSLRQSNDHVNRKQRNFFRRKSKSQERDLSNENTVSEASSKIVNLKPGPITPETESNPGSSPESQYIVRHGEPNEKVDSHFFLAEIKRRWKHAMGREQQRISTDGIYGRFSGERRIYENNGGVKDYIGMSSPTKDHFFIKRISRPSISVEKGEKTSKLKGSERHSNIYIEAKKHLSEMITNGDENVDISCQQVSKPLGRILSLPEYDSSPFGSPRRNSESNFITARMRISGSEKFQNLNENDRRNHASHPSQVAEDPKSQLCVTDNETDDEVQGDNAISNDLETCPNDDKDEMSSEGGVSIVQDTEIVVREEGKFSDSSLEISGSSIARDDENVDAPEVCDEKQYAECSKQDLSEKDEELYSLLGSPLNSSVTKKVEGPESVNDTQEQPSPVSVLEPIFTEDVISPASIRSRSASMQPLRIRFEEHGSVAANQSNRIKTCMDDKESIFEHVKAVLQPSTFNWEELYIRSLSSEILIEPLLLDEVEFFPNQLCHDQTMLFDCINEVLVEVCKYYFGSHGALFVKPKIRPIPNTENTIQEIWQGVYWHLLPMSLPRSLDKIVRKDMAKTETWMDLRHDTDFISAKMSEAILEDLVVDIITSYVNGTLEGEYHAEGLEN